MEFEHGIPRLIDVGTSIKRTWPVDGSRDGPRSARQAFDHEAFVPDRLAGLNLTYSGHLVQAISEAEGSVRALQARARTGGLGSFGRLLMCSESIASSYIEGLNLAPRRFAEAELCPEDASETAREVLGNQRAMERAIAQGSEPASFDVEHHVAIHRALLGGTRLDRFAGVLRESQNWVGGDEYSPRRAGFIPPPEHLVRDLLADLRSFVNDAAVLPIAQAAIAHAQFETIHPFPDGNGRVGRALIHVIARRRGLAPAYVPPVSIALAKAPQAYIAGLKAFERGEIAEWCLRFAEAVTWSCEIADRLLDEQAAILARWMERLAPRANSALGKLIPAAETGARMSLAPAPSSF